MPLVNRPLRVFLSYTKKDNDLVEEFRQKLSSEDWIDAWLDNVKLRPGDKWENKIELAIETADLVLIFISKNSINKEGVVQKEMIHAWEQSLKRPEHAIFLVPVRLEDCNVPGKLKKVQWADYFGDNKKENYKRIIGTLRTRYDQVLQFEKSENNQKAIKPNLTNSGTIKEVVVGEIVTESAFSVIGKSLTIRREAEDRAQEVERLAIKKANEFALELLREKRRAETERKVEEEKKRQETERQQKANALKEPQEKQAQYDASSSIVKILEGVIGVMIVIWRHLRPWIEGLPISINEESGQTNKIEHVEHENINTAFYDDQNSRGTDNSFFNFLSNALVFIGKIIIWSASVYVIAIFVVAAMSWFGVERIEVNRANWLPFAYGGIAIAILKILQSLYIDRFFKRDDRIIYVSVGLYVCQLIVANWDTFLIIVNSWDILRFFFYFIAVLLILVCIPLCIYLIFSILAFLAIGGWFIVLVGAIYFYYYPLNGINLSFWITTIINDPFWMIVVNEVTFAIFSIFAFRE